MKPYLLSFFIFFHLTNLFGQDTYIPTKVSDDKIILDGVLNDKEWENATKVDFDFEVEPGYNIEPIVKTLGYIYYSDKFIYLAFDAETKENVRASVRKRDDFGIFNDDVIGFNIDTYGDGRNNIFIASNPYGSQVDVRVLNEVEEEKRYQISYDLEYESIGAIKGNRYYVEMKIPFSSIPFPNGKNQKWKFGLWRKYKDYFLQSGKVDRDNNCSTCQLEDEIIFNDIIIEKKINLLPYVSSNVSGSYNQNSNIVEYGKIKTNLGIGINAELSKNLSIELTINPDFSQVESDVTKIDANSAYSLSYPEKRPFFNKGTDILNINSDDLQPFYSRSINNPLYALKILNQGTNSRVFFLSSIDNDSPYLIAGNDRSYFGEGDKSLINVFRYQRLLNGGSKIGFLSTSRYYKGGGYGNIFGLDGLFQLSKNIRVSFDILKNYNLEPNTNWINSEDTFNSKTVKLDGEKFNGTGVSIGFLRSTENWTTYLGYKNINPEYRADVGFAVKNDRKWLTFYQSYKKNWDKGFFKGASYAIKKDILYDFNNNLDVMSLDAILNADIIGNTSISYIYDFDFTTDYLGKEYKNYGTSRINFSSNPNEILSITSNFGIGRDIAFNSDNPEIGKELNFFSRIRLQINNSFSIANSIDFSRLKYMNKNEFYYNGFIYRADSKYQFTNSLGIRLVIELNDFNDYLFVQPLFEWTPNPFTIFYIGGNQNLTNNNKNYLVDNSQIFIKFQYLLSL